MKRVLLLLIFLSFSILPFSACSIFNNNESSETSTQQEIKSYLDNITAIINDATEIAVKVSSLYKTAKELDESEVITKCTSYSKEYTDLLARLTELDFPKECLKLREYTIDSISYSAQEVTEFGAAFSTGDIEHLYKSESYYNDAQRAISLATGEMSMLENDY